MDHRFWHERWEQQQIGFHLDHPNPLLVRHGSVLGQQARVLVPLCGKSLDLMWLTAQGHSVIGVELSELAARAFFEEQSIPAEQTIVGPFKHFRAGPIEILCGDFFAVEAAHLRDDSGRGVDAVYDRAALVALPEPMRKRYVDHVFALLPARARGLLISFEYSPSSVSGPPFSVREAEVRSLYEPRLQLRVLERIDSLDREPRFKARGMTALHEVAYEMSSSVAPPAPRS